MHSAGEVITLTLEEIGPLGEATAHHNGETVYVFGGIPGEKVKVELLRRGRSFATARVVEVMEASPMRMEAPCPYFGACTGCQWQHMSYQGQLELKRSIVKEALKAVQGLELVDVAPTVGSPQALGYRNHARFTIGPKGALGFVNRITRKFVPVQHCLLMHPLINQALAQLQERCAETTQLSIRCGANTGSALVQPRLQSLDIPIPSGQRSYQEELMGKTFQIADSSFFQVNTPQTAEMIKDIAHRLGLSGKELLIDAYAGVGTFALLLSPYVREVVAIEESPSAIKDALANIKVNGIENVRLLQGKTEEILTQIDERVDIVIVDPPRTGCHPRALEAIKHINPSRLVYISCDPPSLARDLKALAEESFTVDRIQPIDMFPQTHHIECVAFLSSKVPAVHRIKEGLVLASSSPRRREIISALNAPITYVEPNIDERAMSSGQLAEDIAISLAVAKTKGVADRVSERFILGADTLVMSEGRVLGKPKDPEEARYMLYRLRGKTHRVVTGLALLDRKTGICTSASEVSSVIMRHYSDIEVERYIASGKPMDKAGAYGVQDEEFHPALRVEGCYLNVVGLPLCTVVQRLQRMGFSIGIGPEGKSDGQCIYCHRVPLGEGTKA